MTAKERLEKKVWRYLKEGEKLKRSDIAKHRCGSYWYETKEGIGNCHTVDDVCAASKCYKRRLRDE